MITLRVGSQLVGIRTDTAHTLERARTLLAAWIDDDIGDIPFAFDLVLDPPDAADRRGPRPVPQLRFGQHLFARSRSADLVLCALAEVLGGLVARQDDTQLWFALRALADDNSVVLVEAPSMASSGDRALARAGIDELATWAVVVVPDALPKVRVPPALTGLDWTGAGLAPAHPGWRTYDLAGVVGYHAAHPAPEAHSPAEVLAHFGRRHSAPEWFPLLRSMADQGRVSMVHTRAALRTTVVELTGSTTSDSA